MAFSDDLDKIFKKEAGVMDRDEVTLFRTLADAVCKAATQNGHRANTVEIHKSYINFKETNNIAFYYHEDQKRKTNPSCELADIMFIVYNGNEARLCFMQNKYNKKVHKGRGFDCDTRQLYVLKNRPPYWRGRKRKEKTSEEKILCDAKYSSITNYGVFSRDDRGYKMEYYNADAIISPTGRGRSYVAKPDEKYPKHSVSGSKIDQLNYAYSLKDFGQGLEDMLIGEKYENLDDLLSAVNHEKIIKFFQEIENTKIKYDETKSSILARCIVMVKFNGNITTNLDK